MNKVTINTDSCILLMHLESADANQIKSCISKYTPPTAFGEKLKWFAFRVKQAVLSLFGQSQWQKAQNLIRDNAMKLAVEVGALEAKPATPLSKSRWLLVHRKMHFAAQGLLSLALEVEKKKPTTIEAPQSQIQQYDLKGLLLDIRNLFMVADTHQRMTKLMRDFKPQDPQQAETELQEYLKQNLAPLPQ